MKMACGIVTERNRAPFLRSGLRQSSSCPLPLTQCRSSRKGSVTPRGSIMSSSLGCRRSLLRIVVFSFQALPLLPHLVRLLIHPPSSVDPRRTSFLARQNIVSALSYSVHASPRACHLKPGPLLPDLQIHFYLLVRHTSRTSAASRSAARLTARQSTP